MTTRRHNWRANLGAAVAMDADNNGTATVARAAARKRTFKGCPPVDGGSALRA